MAEMPVDSPEAAPEDAVGRQAHVRGLAGHRSAAADHEVRGAEERDERDALPEDDRRGGPCVLLDVRLLLRVARRVDDQHVLPRREPAQQVTGEPEGFRDVVVRLLPRWAEEDGGAAGRPDREVAAREAVRGDTRERDLLLQSIERQEAVRSQTLFGEARRVDQRGVEDVGARGAPRPRVDVLVVADRERRSAEQAGRERCGARRGEDEIGTVSAEARGEPRRAGEDLPAVFLIREPEVGTPTTSNGTARWRSRSTVTSLAVAVVTTVCPRRANRSENGLRY